MSHEPHSFAPQAGAPWPPPAPLPGPSRLLPILGVVLGLLGLATGTAAWFRAAPSHSAAPAYSDQQVADAKKAVCEAYAKGFRAIRVSGTKKPDTPDEILPATVINARVAEVAAANYFLNSADLNPASPPELLDLIRQLGAIYEDVAVTQLADGSRQDVHPIAAQADELMPKIDQLCQ